MNSEVEYKEYSKVKGKPTYERLYQMFPDLMITNLGEGVNIKFEDGYILTVWFKHHKYCFNKQGIWRFYTGFPELIAIIAEKVNKKPIGKNTFTEDDENDKSAVQKCIDHLNAKAELIGSHKGADHATAMMLKACALELQQYL